MTKRGCRIDWNRHDAEEFKRKIEETNREIERKISSYLKDFVKEGERIIVTYSPGPGHKNMDEINYDPSEIRRYLLFSGELEIKIPDKNTTIHLGLRGEKDVYGRVVTQ